MRRRTLLLLLLPGLIMVGANSILPTMVVFNYSFQTPFGHENKWLGFGHYIKLLNAVDFWAAFVRTFAYSAACLAIEIPLGLGLAMYIPRRGKFAAAFMSIMALCTMIPFLTVGLMWRLMAIEAGPIQDILRRLGFEYSITVPSHAFWTLVVVDAWHWTPLVFLLVTAGLEALPEPPFLAARIDGASRWQTFRRITLPGLRFPLLFVTLLRFIDSFKVYDEPWIMTGGGPGKTTEFLSLYIVRKAIGGFLMGYSSAVSLIYLLVVIIFVYMLLLVLSKGKGLVGG